MRARDGLVAPAVLVAFAASTLPAAVQAQPVLASPRAEGMPASATGSPLTTGSRLPISANGRYVAFHSQAADLVVSPADGNGRNDVFVRDLLTGTTTLVSVRADGTAAGNDRSIVSAMSSDGRYVLFESNASDLVSGDTNSAGDVFVRDLQAGVTTLVSVAVDGVSAGNGMSQAAAMSPDGRFVLFSSDATTLVPTDTNSVRDVFVHDLQTSVTTLVSVNSAGTDSSNQASVASSISADGRYVSFSSLATNVVAGVTDGNNDADVFRRDLQAGVTQLVSATVAGTATGNVASQPVAMTGDGRYVLFSSAASNLTAITDIFGQPDVFVRDSQTQTTVLVSVDAAGTTPGGGESTAVAISGNGRYVAFHSTATNLVAGDLNFQTDAFVRDLQLGTTALVSLDSGGNQGNAPSFVSSMTADARYVVLESLASNFAAGDLNGSTDVFVRDRQLGTTTLATVAAAGGQSAGAPSYPVAITPDGRYVVVASFADDMVAGDLNGGLDLFVRDLQAASTAAVSARAALPVSATPSSGSVLSAADSVSADGRFVAFSSPAADLVPVITHAQQVYVRDLQRAITTMATLNPAGTAGGNIDSWSAGISADGRYVLIRSFASDLVSGVVDGNFASDVFVRDLQAAVTTLVSVRAAGGATGDFFSEPRAITPDGRYVLFSSPATNLVANDANFLIDVFVRDLQTSTTAVVSTNAAGSGTANGRSTAVAVTPNGRFVVFDSEATNLVALPVGGAGQTQVYLRDLQTGTTELISVNAAGSAGGNASSTGTAISTDGRYVLFGGAANDLGSGLTAGRNNVFLRDRQAGTTVLVSRNLAATGNGNGHSFARAMSANGRYVAFDSEANDLVTGDDNGFLSDVYVRDLQAGTTTLVSVDASEATAAGGPSWTASMSADGRLVGFESLAPDVVAGDSNGIFDAFVRDLVTGTTTLLSANGAGVTGNGASTAPAVNAAGTRAVFHSTASDLVTNDSNAAHDVFATPFPAPDLPFADGFESGTLIRWTGFRP